MWGITPAPLNLAPAHRGPHRRNDGEHREEDGRHEHDQRSRYVAARHSDQAAPDAHYLSRRRDVHQGLCHAAGTNCCTLTHTGRVKKWLAALCQTSSGKIEKRILTHAQCHPCMWNGTARCSKRFAPVRGRARLDKQRKDCITAVRAQRAQHAQAVQQHQLRGGRAACAQTQARHFPVANKNPKKMPTVASGAGLKIGLGSLCGFLPSMLFAESLT